MSNSLLGNYLQYLGDSVDKRLEEILLDLLPRSEKISYLDVGCYDGKKTLERAKKIGTNKIIGVDLPTIGATKALKRGVKVIFGDLDEKWPIRSNSVDCITATEVIEHLVDVDNFFKEIKRILKPGGKVIITTDNLASYHNILALLLGNQPYTGPFLSKKYPIGHRPNAKYYSNKAYSQMRPHLNVMTAKALKQLLTFYGFSILKQDGAGMYPLPPFVARITASVFRNHASHCLFYAQMRSKNK